MRKNRSLSVIASVGLGLLSTISGLAQPPASSGPQNEGAGAEPWVVVYGAVRSPSRFRLDRRLRLATAIAMAGGVTREATETIKVIHSTVLNCEPQHQVMPGCSGCLNATPQPQTFDIYKLSQLSSEDVKVNPYLQAGDRVLVVEAVTVYVMGHVSVSQGLQFDSKPTLSQAIAMAGGVLGNSNTKGIKIFRSKSDSTRETIIVDLNAIEKGRCDDPILEPYDIIEVTPKRNMRRRPLMSSVASDQSQLPLCIIW